MPLAGRVWYQVYNPGTRRYVSYFQLAAAIRFADLIGVKWITVLQDIDDGYHLSKKRSIQVGTLNLRD